MGTSVRVLFVFLTLSALPAARERGERRGIENQTIGGVEVAVWAPPGTEPAPLIVFSHGYHGCAGQSTFLTRALAADGYLVLAPNHKDAACKGGFMGAVDTPPFRKPADWSDHTFDDRRDDIAHLLDALREDKTWSGRIDWDHVGLAGHSLGGYTVLGVAGAWPEWRRKEVKAVLALSPYCQPYANQHTLGKLEVPVMYQGGSLDLGITPFIQRPDGCYAQTPSPAYFVDLARAGHLAWTDLNPRHQEVIVRYGLAFFARHLRGDKTAKPEAEGGAGVAEVRSK
jgi:predicted dienelactone hydrolase